MAIEPATTGEQLAQVRDLFEEYWASFGFTPCFQNFGAELAALPDKYVPAEGGLLGLASIEGQPAGCVALRRLDATTGEFKRLYVRAQFRGFGVGRELLAWVIGAARSAGYRRLVCDTMPVMADALAMYRRNGFETTGPYSEVATPGAIYLRLEL